MCCDWKRAGKGRANGGHRSPALGAGKSSWRKEICVGTLKNKWMLTRERERKKYSRKGEERVQRDRREAGARPSK